jgi:hypothetical protein
VEPGQQELDIPVRAGTVLGGIAMTKYTDTNGNSVILCDHCRADMPLGSPAFTLAPGRIADGYIARDYDKGELILCPSCAVVVGQIMTLMGIKRADSMTITAEAA